MNKKKINVLLIIAVFCIWGVVSYKLIAPYFSDTDIVQIKELPAKATIAKTRKKDAVVLNFPERDPFLGKTKSVSKPKKIASKKVKKRPVASAKPVLWPKIEYLGFVKSSNSKGRLGLMRIDGRLHRVNAKDEVNGLQIIEISKVALVVLNGKEERSFVKN